MQNQIIRVCVLKLVLVCVTTHMCVCEKETDDGWPVDPQGRAWEQVYCSVLQPCQDTQLHRASHVHLSPPLPLPLSVLMPHSLPLYASTCFRLLFSSILLPDSEQAESHDNPFYICISFHCLCKNLTKCPGDVLCTHRDSTAVITVPLFIINRPQTLY